MKRAVPQFAFPQATGLQQPTAAPKTDKGIVNCGIARWARGKASPVSDDRRAMVIGKLGAR